MSKLVLPKFNSMQLPQGVSFELLPAALARWNSALAAKEDEDERPATIDIYDVIGQDWMGNGWTAKRVAGILRNNKGRKVNVNINSPDVF